MDDRQRTIGHYIFFNRWSDVRSLFLQTAIQEPNSETMSLKIRFYCLKCSIFIGTLLIFQTAVAQKKEKPLISKYDLSGLDKILEEKQPVIGKDYVVLIWKKDDTLTYKK